MLRYLIATIVLVLISSSAFPQAGPSSTASPRWKSPVSTSTDLPSYELAGTCRSVLDTNTIYCYNGSSWQAAGSTSGGPWTLSGSNLYTSGNYNVGVGNSSPSTKFQVVDTSTSSPRGIMSAQYNDGTDGARFNMRKARGTLASPTTIVSGDMLGRLVASGYDGSNYLEMGAIGIETGGTIASTRVPTHITFSTATDATPSVLTENMRITESGNIGIGTTIPANKVDIVGSLGIIGAGNFGIGTSDPAGKLSVKGVGTGTAYTVLLKNSNETSTVAIYDNGNIGINTTTPSANLSIYKINTSDAPFAITSGGVNTGNYLLISSAGNVGIGTWAPSATVSVVKGGAYNIMNVSSTATGAGDYITINSIGYVGIGSTNPGVSLDVNGTYRNVSIGTTTAGTLTCWKADKSQGWCSGSVTGNACATCN